MKFPSILNPFRHTKFEWLIPFTWAVLKSAAITAPITIEVFLHHRFGVRSGKALLKGFILILIVFAVVSRGEPPASTPLFPGYVFAYALAAFGQWLGARHRQDGHIHSYSTGEPWSFWRQFTTAPSRIRCYFEPALCLLIALIVLIFDSPLGHWLFFATGALFIKELVLASRQRSHQLDAADSRIESQLFAPPIPREPEHFVEARPAPPTRGQHRR